MLGFAAHRHKAKCENVQGDAEFLEAFRTELYCCGEEGERCGGLPSANGGKVEMGGALLGRSQCSLNLDSHAGHVERPYATCVRIGISGVCIPAARNCVYVSEVRACSY